MPNTDPTRVPQSPAVQTNPLVTNASLRHAGRRVVESVLGTVLRRIDARLCRPGQLPRTGIHRVLVLRPNHRLGNTILVTPLLNAIETTYPGAEIDIVSAGPVAKNLLCGRFQVRRIICLSRRIVRHLPATAACVHRLRSTTYDLAIDPCTASNTGHLLLGICRARYKVGLLSTPGVIDQDLPEHLAKRGVHLLRRALGCPPTSAWPRLDLRLTTQERHQGQGILDHLLAVGTDRCHASPKVIGLFANATGNKRLPESWWNTLMNRLQATRPDISVVEVLAAHGLSQIPGASCTYYTSDPRKLAAVISAMQGFVCADCGVMHLAAAVATPTLGLFTRANRNKYAPYGGCNSGLDVVSAADTGGNDMTQLSILAWIQQVVPADSLRPDRPERLQREEHG